MTAMIAGQQTGSLINHLMSGAAADEPQVGMGATILKWTDRAAGTIIAVDAKGFTVQADTATRTDNYGMSDSQSYAYAPNPQGQTYRIERVARGKAKGAWREGGRKDGYGVLIGHRDQHHDYSF